MQVFVGALDVVDIADFGGALSDERGEHAGAAGAHVKGLHGRGCQCCGAGDDGGLAGGDDVRAHLPQLGDVEQPVVEHALVDGAGAGCLREEGGELGLEVGGEARVWKRLRVHRLVVATARDTHATVGDLDRDTRLAHLSDEGVKVLRNRFFDLDLAARDGGGEGEGAGFEAVGHDAMLSAAKRSHTLDAHDRRAGGV